MSIVLNKLGKAQNLIDVIDLWRMKYMRETWNMKKHEERHLENNPLHFRELH